MTPEKLSSSIELEEFQYARRVLMQAIWREIDKDDARWERSWYHVWRGMMLYQIKFYMKCLYAWDDRTNEREGWKMRIKYKNLHDATISYFNALDNISDITLENYTQQSDIASDIIASFEREILSITELKKLRENSQKEVFFALSKKD